MAERASIVLAVVVALAGGCSPLVVPGPRTVPTTGQVVCRATYAPPLVDAALATAATVIAVWGLTEEDTGETDGHTLTIREVVAVPSLVAVFVFGFSTGYGFNRVARCRNAAGATTTAHVK